MQLYLAGEGDKDRTVRYAPERERENLFSAGGRDLYWNALHYKRHISIGCLNARVT